MPQKHLKSNDLRNLKEYEIVYYLNKIFEDAIQENDSIFQAIKNKY